MCKVEAKSWLFSLESVVGIRAHGVVTACFYGRNGCLTQWNKPVDPRVQICKGGEFFGKEDKARHLLFFV